MSADQKSKFGNILEIPYLSKFHRHLLDGFKVHKLSQKIKGLQMKSILDVCCGLGEYSTLGIAQYIGVDNSPNSIDFAQKKYSRHQFVRADATAMPFQDKSFDAVLFAGSSHHFSDELLKKVLKECDRLSRRIIIIADIVKTKDQGRISRFLYSIDRGKHIRNAEALRGIIQTVLKYPNYHQSTHRTFPGFYTHAVFVFRK